MEEEQVLRNLIVLSSLSQNDKLMTHDYAFNVYTPTTWRGLMRMWYREGREQNVDHIKQTVRQGIAITTARMREASELTPDAAGVGGAHHVAATATLLRAKRMLDALHKSRDGMRNLMTTYRDDAALYAQFVLLMQEIEDYSTIVSTCVTGGGSRAGGLRLDR